jgi:hypothetical protein
MNGENSVGWGPQLDRDVSAKVLLAAFVNTTGDQRLKNSNRDDTVRYQVYFETVVVS